MCNTTTIEEFGLTGMAMDQAIKQESFDTI